MPIAILALALFAYSTSVVAGTNGFIAAFVAGMAFGTMDHHNDEAALEFTEQAGTLLSLLVWFIFGAVMLVPGMEDLGWRDAAFALLALTLLRMVPVAIALAGTGLDHTDMAFVGWFGPAASPPWSSASSPSIPWLQPNRRSCSPRSRSRLHSVCCSMVSRLRHGRGDNAGSDQLRRVGENDKARQRRTSSMTEITIESSHRTRWVSCVPPNGNAF